MQPVGYVAVEGARLHGHAVHSSECPVRDVESLQHPEAWRRLKTGAVLSHKLCRDWWMCTVHRDAAYQVL